MSLPVITRDRHVLCKVHHRRRNVQQLQSNEEEGPHPPFVCRAPPLPDLHPQIKRTVPAGLGRMHNTVGRRILKIHFHHIFLISIDTKKIH